MSELKDFVLAYSAPSWWCEISTVSLEIIRGHQHKILNAPACVFRSRLQLPGRSGHQGDGRRHPHAVRQNPGGQQRAADQRHHLLCQKDPQRLRDAHTRILDGKTFVTRVNTARQVL